VIALVLVALLAGPPALACPPGTEHRGASPFEGFEEWCILPDDRLPDGGNMRHGPARSYYDDGTVSIESSYRDGKLHGRYVEFFRGGVMAKEGFYEAGKRTGRWSFFFEDGTLMEESGWKDDLRDGPFLQFWPGGKPKNIGRHCVGVQCGRWRTFDESGRQLSSVEYGEQRGHP